MSKWISVDDRLPTTDALLFWVESKTMAVGSCITTDTETLWLGNIGNGYYTDADTAPDWWMPLPEHPRRTGIGGQTMEINGYNFICTCDACPEQYDIYSNGEKVGYVRLRFGCLTADYNNVEVYHHRFNDDEYKGSFDTNAERDKFLTLIAKKLKFEERMRAKNGLN